MTYNVFLSIGSNINPEDNVRAAIKGLKNIATIRDVSSVYETKPVDVEAGGENFHNLCVAIQTDLTPDTLKSTLRELENTIGRDHSSQEGGVFQSRKIDVDILIYEPEPDDFSAHPQIYDQAYVVVPLGEIYDPSSRIDLPEDVEAWKNRCNMETILGTVDYDPPLTVTN